MPAMQDRPASKAWHLACLAVSTGALLLVTGLTHAETPQKIVLDADPGIDDAMAILLALNSPELNIEAITIVPGNVTCSGG